MRCGLVLPVLLGQAARLQAAANRPTLFAKAHQVTHPVTHPWLHAIHCIIPSLPALCCHTTHPCRTAVPCPLVPHALTAATPHTHASHAGAVEFIEASVSQSGIVYVAYKDATAAASNRATVMRFAS